MIVPHSQEESRCAFRPRGDRRPTRHQQSTISGTLAASATTPYLRVDRIEQAIVAWSFLSHPVGPVGYAVAHQLAAEQLQLGLDAIVECVNPTALTRDARPQTAAGAGAGIVEVEVVCSDRAEHRRRVETLTSPAWRNAPNRGRRSRVRAVEESWSQCDTSRDTN